MWYLSAPLVSVLEVGAAAALIVFMTVCGTLLARLCSVDEEGRTHIGRLALSFLFLWGASLHGAFVAHARYGWGVGLIGFLFATSALSALIVTFLWLRARREFRCWRNEVPIPRGWLPQEERESGRIPRTDDSKSD